MRGFQLRKYRRLMYRAFPDLVKPTKRTYSPPVQLTQEQEQMGNIGCIGFAVIVFIIFMMAIAR